MEHCSICNEPHSRSACPVVNTVVAGKTASELASELRVYVTDQSLARAALMVYLEEGASGKRFPVALPECRVGRSPECDLMFAGDDNVSRVHFVINYEVGKFFITDLGSTNGTIVNGERISGRVQIKSGDRVRAGRFGLTFAVSKAFWEAGHIRTSELKRHRPEKPAAANLTKTRDQSISRQQRQAIEAAIFASELAESASAATPGEQHGHNITPPLGMSAELISLENELRLLRSQAEEFGKRILECERKIADLKSKEA